MIDVLLRVLLVGGGAYAGAKLGERYLGGTAETPVWTGHVGFDPGRPAISITQVRQAGKVYYRVYVVADEQWARVAACWQYAEALAEVQSWEHYVDGGGTVMAWLTANERREQEIAALEDQLRGP